MRRFILCFISLWFCCHQSFSIDYNVLREKINQQTLSNIYTSPDKVREIILLSDSGKYIDDSIKELYLKVLLPGDLITKWTENQLPDGSWPDIDYNDRNRSSWQPLDHLIRILHLCKSYFSSESSLKNSPELKAHIKLGLTYWLTTKPTARNWWFNEIGANKVLGPILLLMRDELEEDLRAEAIICLSSMRLGKKGQNKIWNAGNVIYRAVFEEDDNLLQQAYADIVSEITYQGEEGLQSDFSFHLHGPQLQFGNYGLSYALSISYWAAIFQGTSLAFSREKTDVLCNYVSKGLYQTLWNGYIDFNALGRHFFPDIQRGKGIAFEQVLANLAFIDDLPERLSRVSAFYFRSDYIIHVGKEWTASVRMSSTRVQGSESGNGENLKGYYLGDGVMSIRRYGDEYENIFPVWDWRKLPGATIPQSNDPLPVLTWEGYRNGSDFVGGISDGKNSLAVFVLQRDSVYGKKSYFFFEDKLVCLGTGISSGDNQKLITAINQTRKKGDVLIRKDGENYDLPRTGILELMPPLSVSHAGLLYHLHTGSNTIVSVIGKQGGWKEIVSSYDNLIEDQNVFLLTTEDKQGDYGYSIYPENKKNGVLDNHISHSIVRNDEKCQAVVCTQQNIVQAVFHSTDNLHLPDGTSLTPLQPMACLYYPESGGGVMYVADPTQKLISLSFFMKGKYKNGKYDTENDSTLFEVELPAERYKGQAVRIALEKIS